MDYTKAAEITRRYNQILSELTEKFEAEITAVVPEAHPTSTPYFYVQYTVDEVSEGFEYAHTSKYGSGFYRRMIDGVKFVEVTG